MENNVNKDVKKYKEQNIRKRKYKRILWILSCMVVFCTVYMLMLPAITMEKDVSQKINCSYETLNVHTHLDACYDQENNVICGYADYVVHTHDTYCYNKDSELLCSLPVIEAHVHDNMCYENISIAALEEPLTDDVIDEDDSVGQQSLDATSEIKIVCDKKEIIPHKHDENCFDIDGNLICEKLEILEHVHIEACLNAIEDKNTNLESDEANISLLADMPADAVYVKTQTELQNAIEGGSRYIALNGNFGVYIKDNEGAGYGNLQDSLVIPRGKNITLDLNGYTLWHHGSDELFTIGENSVLNIVDSEAVAETVEYPSGSLVANTGTSTSSNGKASITYYVTNSKVTNDSTGATTETLEKHTVTSTGTIISNDQVTFNVNGGTLNIQSGMIYGGTNHAIEQSRGTTNVTGGYICGFTTNKDGGAVYTTGGTLNIDGHGVIAINSSLRGGGVFSTNTDVNIKGGVIASNTSSRSESSGENGAHYGGAGVYVDNGTLDMDGGYITNNYVTSKGYFDGGGGILACGNCKVAINGGYITGNEASSGGGIRTNWKNAVEIEIIGGHICSNVARTSEGGGVAVNMNATGVITGGYINNNVTNTQSDWGGGGIFCSAGSWLYVRNALIVDNHAGGFGGGVAGCSTGRTYLFVKEGAALYDNYADGLHMSGSTSTKNEDHIYASNNEVFMNNGYQDYFCALNSIVEGSMLGGQAAGWHGSADGVPVRATARDTLVAAYIMGLSSEPTEQGKLAAQAEAKVYITGNSSYTHGGGILCNGYMIVGETDNIDLGARIELKAYKEYLGDDLSKIELEDGQFTFEVVDAKTEAVIATATNDSKGAINFKERLSFTKDGQYVYYIREVKGDDAKVSYDGTVYKLTVDVIKQTSFFDEVLINGETITITKTEYLLDKITVEKRNGLDSWEIVSVNENPSNSDSSAIPLELTSTSTFTNIIQSKKNIKVIKQWEGQQSNNHPNSVTVDLLRNGEVYETVTLNSSNNWQYEWNGLEVVDNSNKEYNYTIKEHSIFGYVTDYEEITENTLKGYWVPATSIVEGSKYIIVSPECDYALYVTDAKINAGFSNNEKNQITTERLVFNRITYEKAIPESIISSRNIFRAESTKSNSNERIVLKNLGTKNSSWLLAQNADGNYLKGTDGISYSSGVKLENKRIRIQENWDTKNSWRYLSYDDSKFTTSSGTNNAAILYEYIETSVNSVTTYKIINKPIDNVDFSINITKVSATDSKMTLAGAEFNLISNNKEPLYFIMSSPGVYDLADPSKSGATQTLVTNNNGKLVIQKLEAGKYILRETKAPSGYQPIEDMEVILGAEDDNGDISLIVRKTIEDNITSYALPKTGGSGAFLYVIGSILLIATIVFLWYDRRKNKDNDYKVS